jgi:hypothetical protein
MEAAGDRGQQYIVDGGAVGVASLPDLLKGSADHRQLPAGPDRMVQGRGRRGVGEGGAGGGGVPAGSADGSRRIGDVPESRGHGRQAADDGVDGEGEGTWRRGGPPGLGGDGGVGSRIEQPLGQDGTGEPARSRAVHVVGRPPRSARSLIPRSIRWLITKATTATGSTRNPAPGWV